MPDGRPLEAELEPARPNPPLLIVDTDVLVQLLLGNEFRPLRELKRCYRVQLAIVEAVEMEIRTPFAGKSLRRYLSTIEPRLQKALGNGTLLLLDGRTFPSVVGTGAHAVETQISITATRYHRIVDYGEAYSHATAAIFGVPIMSHDFTAVRALQRAGEQVTHHLLRAFDLYTFSHQCNVLSVKECDDLRQALARHGEWLPDAFLKRSFPDGLAIFYARLLDRDSLAVGSVQPLELYDIQLLLGKS